MNQRQNSPSEATYAQCGRQHFHPTFAVAISAGSMISAWPKEQWPHPEKKGRVTNVHPERTNHPSGRAGKIRDQFRFSGPLGCPLLGVGEGRGDRKEARGPQQVGVVGGGAAWVPTDAHIRLSQGASPLAWYFFPGGKCGSPRAPPAGGERTEVEALPSHHPANWYPQVRKSGACGQRPAGGC